MFSQGEFSSNTRPSGASTRSAASAVASSRSQISTDRHGVITSGASIAARHSATRAGKTPSGYSPGGFADLDETQRDLDQGLGDIGHPHAGVTSGQQQSGTVGEHLHADVGTQAGHVGAAVVETEPEPAAQFRQPGLGADRRVELTDPCPHVG